VPSVNSEWFLLDQCRLLREENDKLRGIVNSLAARVHAQSELLTGRAGRRRGWRGWLLSARNVLLLLLGFVALWALVMASLLFPTVRTVGIKK
jgi:hypothetical protein